MPNDSETARNLLRHTVARLAYRARKPLEGAPLDVSDFRVTPGTRSAGEILAHIGDLFDWALALAQGRHTWKPIAPTTWDRDVDRFFTALGAFDTYLAGEQPLGW